MSTTILASAFCAALALSSRAQETGNDVEDVARFLLDAPIYSHGDFFASVEGFVAWVGAHPDHPLAEAALSMLESLAEDPDDALFLGQRLLEIDPAAPWEPLAARRLSILQGRAHMLLASPDAPPTDHHPEFLHRFLALGSWQAGVDAPPQSRANTVGYLRPLQMPLWPQGDAGGGSSPWTLVERNGWRRHVDPLLELPEGPDGQLWLLTYFDVPDGGPAWIEVEMVGASNLAGREFDGTVPGYAVWINGGEARVSTLLDGEHAEVDRHGVVLRAGRNSVEIQTSLGGGVQLRFALRVLAPDGRPYPGLESDWTQEDVGMEAAELGEEVDALPPSASPGGSIEHLQALSQRGPSAEALLGLLLARDGRRMSGLTHLGVAYQRAGDAPWIATHFVLTTLASGHLPEAWCQARAREMAERVLAAAPDHHAMGLLVASIEAAEDREEAAIERLERLIDAHRRSPQTAFALYSVLQSMGLDVRAEAALEEAVLRAPNKVRTLAALAEHLASVGRRREAAETREKAARVSGGLPNLLSEAAEQWAHAGETGRALELLREAVGRDPELGAQYADLLIQIRQLDEAEAWLERGDWRESESKCRQMATIALLRGDETAERDALGSALAIEPSRRSTRERMRQLTGAEPAREFLAAQRLDVEEVLGSFDGEGREDSLVALLDHSVAWVFEDGAVETLTQNLHQVRDLQACERMKEVQVEGEMLTIASIDGRTHERTEPVLVDDKYVMPALEPGDFVEITYRRLASAPEDGVLRLGGWFFASLEQTFERSRYVVSWPRAASNGHPALELRRAGANLDGVEESIEEQPGPGDRVVHVLEARGRARVVPEPAIATPATFLPWVEFGMDDVPERVADWMRAEALWNTQPTPEIVDLATRATEGIMGEEAQAKALYRFVNESIDQRAWTPSAPAHTFFLRRGNPAFLYLALLRARGIDAELVWSRGVTPNADEEKQPPFFDAGRWRRQPLVLVRPRDGREAWCEMHAPSRLSVRLLPYGMLFGHVSQARSFATLSGTELVTPGIPLEEGPSVVFTANLHVDPGGAAQVDGRVEPKGGLAFHFKEAVQKMPEDQIKSNVRNLASRLMRGLSVERFRFPGLEEEGLPLVLEGEGSVRSFLDREADGWVAPLPFPPLELSSQYAGQGERRLPFRFPASLVVRATIRLELPASMELVDPPPRFEAACPGGTYLLDVRPEADRTWVVERAVAIDVFDLPASEFGAFRDFCRRVDEAESARLRLRSK